MDIMGINPMHYSQKAKNRPEGLANPQVLLGRRLLCVLNEDDRVGNAVCLQ